MEAGRKSICAESASLIEGWLTGFTIEHGSGGLQGNSARPQRIALSLAEHPNKSLELKCNTARGNRRAVFQQRHKIVGLGELVAITGVLVDGAGQLLKAENSGLGENGIVHERFLTDQPEGYETGTATACPGLSIDLSR